MELNILTGMAILKLLLQLLLVFFVEDANALCVERDGVCLESSAGRRC